MAGNLYLIQRNRMLGSYHPGFELSTDPEGVLESFPNEALHYLYFRAIDSAAADSGWGRLSFRLACDESVVCYVYAVALNEDSFYRQGKPMRIEDFLCNEEESHAIKKEFLWRVSASRFVNQKDILLYDLKGRYLYLIFEVLGEGACRISHMRVDQQGDNFMNTFPEIYREQGGFFHRFMSVFSSIYEDFQVDIDNLPKLLDIDSCPERLLPMYGRWLGIDVGNDFLDEKIMRPLVKEAYQLNRMKGTKAVLERLTEIFLGEKALVLERNVMADYVGKEQMAEFEKLYGNSVYDVTILVNKPMVEAEKSQLMFLLNQFKPVRSRLHLIYLKQTGTLDSYSYLDMNARVPGDGSGQLDGKQSLGGVIRLK